MSQEATGRVFEVGEANTLFVSIPSVVATDSSFPFDEDDPVSISIEDDHLRIGAPDEVPDGQ